MAGFRLLYSLRRMNIYHPAQWSTHLVVTSLLATILLLGIGLFLLVMGWRISRRRRPAGFLLAAIGIAHIGVLVPVVAHAIRGYAITPESIEVRRLVGVTKWPIAELSSAEVIPNAVRGRRVNGNDGFFRYSGHWRNSRLGDFQVYATEKERTVVLQFRGDEERPVVLSPGDPETFVRDLEKIIARNPGEEPPNRSSR